MTDTTDIKALRELAETAKVCGGMFAISGEQALSLLDQLEAERQRADDAQTLLMPDGLHENTKALVIGFANAMAAKLYKSEQKYGWSDEWMQDDWQDKCLTDFNHHISKGDPLDVANYCAFMHYHGWSTALKGDQVPVAITDDMAMAFHAATTDSALGRDDMEEIKAGLQAVQELFSAPQNPVVLPIDEMSYKDACEFVSINGMRNEDRPTLAMRVWNSCRKAAIEDAGGIVKDGE